MTFHWLARAQEDYLLLPAQIKRKAKKTFRFLEQNPWHPSLHIEKIDIKRNIWSGRIDQSYRFTFQWIAGGVLIRRMGAHQDAYRNP